MSTPGTITGLTLNPNYPTALSGPSLSQTKLANLLGVKYENISNAYLFNQTLGDTSGTTGCKFDTKMYIGMFRKLNLYCPFIYEPSSIWRSQGQFLIT